jgi:hypothetical protein
VAEEDNLLTRPPTLADLLMVKDQMVAHQAVIVAVVAVETQPLVQQEQHQVTVAQVLHLL